MNTFKVVFKSFCWNLIHVKGAKADRNIQMFLRIQLVASSWSFEEIRIKFQDHYYQGGFTLVAGGLKTVASCVKPTQALIHPNSVWIQKSIAELHPKNNSVILEWVKFEYLQRSSVCQNHSQ